MTHFKGVNRPEISARGRVAPGVVRESRRRPVALPGARRRGGRLGHDRRHGLPLSPPRGRIQKNDSHGLAADLVAAAQRREFLMGGRSIRARSSMAIDMTKVLLIAPLGSGKSAANVIGGNRLLAAESVRELGKRDFEFEILDMSGGVTNLPPWKFQLIRLARFLRVIRGVASKIRRSQLVFPRYSAPFGERAGLVCLGHLQNRAPAHGAAALRGRPQLGVPQIWRRCPPAGRADLDALFVGVCRDAAVVPRLPPP